MSLSVGSLNYDCRCEARCDGALFWTMVDAGLSLDSSLRVAVSSGILTLTSDFIRLGILTLPESYI